MPTFKNQENKVYALLPKGDYPFTVTGIESGIQSGNGKTAGSPFWELKLEVQSGTDRAVVFERLIDHPTCDFKIDTFLRSANAAPPPGTAFEFDESAAETAGVLFIDPIGLRGHAAVIVDEYQPSDTTKPKQKRNKISAFLTDKPKLQRLARQEEKPAEPSQDAPAAEGQTDECPF